MAPPVDDETTRHALDAFALLGPVTARRMFGGVGIFCDRTMFALVYDGVLYLKTGASNIDDFEDHGAEPFRYTRSNGTATSMSYHEVPAEVMDDTDRLFEWGMRSLAVAMEARS